MKPKILLVNPPIYDFTAYDFWIKPYGLLSVAGFLRNKADMSLFDYLDREHESVTGNKQFASDKWGKGKFPSERIASPSCLEDVPRYYRRLGLSRDIFIEFLKSNGPFDFAFVQTMMTYWYLGIAEVIEDIRKVCPAAKIVLGGNYATICPNHAEKLGADFVVKGIDLDPLWKFVGIEPDLKQPSLWESYKKLKTGVLKLTEGCPFKCTYCSVPKIYNRFAVRDFQRSLDELELMVKLGAKNTAFYDDALLYKAEDGLIPFLNEVINRRIEVNFHSPNALNARFITQPLAGLMIEAGFKTFYLGFESASKKWQEKTGAKVFSAELAKAVEYLKQAGADAKEITAYQILGHPDMDTQELEKSMYFVRDLGIRGMLADFSPIPSTADGQRCAEFVDLDEPLMHNKSVYPVIAYGFEQCNRFKDLQRKLNREIKDNGVF
ncbi:unnamed protein product [marine sediment metagenome]|uniref:Radical SAM core domain-containing protein n=1 Tax=marine sediment metagenome TaxID=412755 RepID=X0U0M9_9ZZZZ